MSDHEHQFPEENQNGTLVAFPCLLCALPAADALKFAAEDRASFEAEIAEVRTALEESLKLQAHYAELLNMHDGGHRLIFKTTEAWLTRLKGTKS